MSTADIIAPLVEGDEVNKAFVYIDSFAVNREGSKSLSGVEEVNDKWQILSNLAASMAPNGEVLLTSDGREVTCPVPKPYKSDCWQVADIKHDPRVMQAIALIRSVLIDLHTGALVPNETVEQVAE